MKSTTPKVAGPAKCAEPAKPGARRAAIPAARVERALDELYDNIGLLLRDREILRDAVLRLVSIAGYDMFAASRKPNSSTPLLDSVVTYKGDSNAND